MNATMFNRPENYKRKYDGGEKGGWISSCGHPKLQPDRNAILIMYIRPNWNENLFCMRGVYSYLNTVNGYMNTGLNK